MLKGLQTSFKLNKKKLKAENKTNLNAEMFTNIIEF